MYITRVGGVLQNGVIIIIVERIAEPSLSNVHEEEQLIPDDIIWNCNSMDSRREDSLTARKERHLPPNDEEHILRKAELIITYSKRCKVRDERKMLCSVP